MRISQMRSAVILGFLLIFSVLSLQAETVETTLYINKGDFKTVDNKTFSYYAFNTDTVFSQINARVVVKAGDSLVLKIVNTDSVVHGFSMPWGSVEKLINPNDSFELVRRISGAETYVMYDHTEGGKYSYMGLSTMLVVKLRGDNFYWNIKDHMSSFNDALEQGQSVDWNNYYPEYFTINGQSNPHIDDDSSARVVGKVDDTIIIHMVNSGRSIHSIHFHGYHCEIVHSSKYREHKGRIKDTFVIYGGEVLVLRLVPHQAGEFPVHDHNLVAVTGGGIYPNGMFTTLLIEE